MPDVEFDNEAVGSPSPLLDDEDDSLYFSDVVFAGAGPLQRLPMVLSGEIFRGLVGCFRKFGDIIQN